MEERKDRLKKCMNCGGTSFEVGKINAKYGCTFNSPRMKDMGFWGKYEFGQYNIEAYLCLDCGFLHNFAVGNYEELRDRTK